MTDHRRTGRKKTFLAAYARPAAGQPFVPCLVRDMSRAGARITIAEAAGMPSAFHLQINGRSEILDVETRWQTATELGVRLVARRPVEACERLAPPNGAEDETARK